MREFAEVLVNGIRHPVLWKPPFRVDVTDAVLSDSAGRSPNAPIEIVVRVTNLWPNRLIGDERLPPDREWKPGKKWLKEIPETKDDWPNLGQHKASLAKRTF